MFPLTPDQHHWLDVATEDEGWCSFRSCTPSRSRARTENCLCVAVLCTIIMLHKGMSSSYKSVDCIELWSCMVWLSVFQVPPCLRSSWWCMVWLSVFQVPPCLRSSWWCICSLNKILLTSFSLPFSEPSPVRLTNHRPSVLWHCWLGPKKVVHQTYDDNCVLNMLTSIRPSIELCCLVVFDLSCNVLFCHFFFFCLFFIVALPLMANKVVCV